MWGGFTAITNSGPHDALIERRFLFTAREWDVETGLYHYRARAYSPELGRFLQQDPIAFLGGDLNLLKYVSNGPVNSRDPLGLMDLGHIVKKILAEVFIAVVRFIDAHASHDGKLFA